MTNDLKRSPLAHREALSAPSGQFTMRETPFVGLLTLRGEPGKLARAVRSALGLDLAASPGTFTKSDEAAAMWIGPDEWIVITQPGAEEAAMGQLKSDLASVHSQVVNVTDYYTTLSLKGAATRDVLAKITMVDLHPRAFQPGYAISSIFGHAGAWLQMTDDENGSGVSFNLYIRRSMADYLWCLLADGAREYGVPAQDPIGQVKLHLPHFETA